MKYKNIIFFAVDTLRRTQLGCYGYPGNTSPNLDKLASKSYLFHNAIATSSNTDPAFTSMITGLYPFSHGIVNHASNIAEGETQKVPNIPFFHERLRDAGYKTAAFDFLGRWHQRGYDFYSGFYRPPTGEKSGPGGDDLLLNAVRKVRKIFHIRPGTSFQKILEKTPLYNFLLKKDLRRSRIYTARQIADETIRMLDEHNGPSYFFLHFMDVHQPYLPEKQYVDEIDTSFYKTYYPEGDVKKATLFTGDQTGLQKYVMKQSVKGCSDAYGVIRKYDALVRYTDDQIGRIISHIDKKGELEESLFVVLADHGENLVDHKRYFTHEIMSGRTIEIPFMVYAPCDSGLFYQPREGYVQPVDAGATILKLAGLDIGGYDFDGHVLFSDQKTDKNQGELKTAEEKERSKDPAASAVHDAAVTINHSAVENKAALTQNGMRLYISYKTPKRLKRVKTEFYNITDDPMELHDLSNDPASASEIERMTAHLDASIKTWRDKNALIEADSGFHLDQGEKAQIEQKFKDLGYM